MHKKIISVILALSVVLSCNAAFASNILNGLGINNISETDELVTRAGFAEAVAIILNGGTAPAPCGGVFTDVGAAHEHSGSVYYIYNMGLISGYGDSRFGPDDALYSEQAVKILVSALGYDVIAASKGGYPTGYIAVAQSIDLLDGLVIESGKALDGYTASVLMENAAACDMLIQTGFGDDESYSTIEGRTLLTEYMHLKKVEGIVKDNGITSLTGNSAVGDGMVVIGTKVFKCGDSGAELMLGASVEAYVTDDSSTYQTIKYIAYSDECIVDRIPAKNLIADDATFSHTNIVYNDIYGAEKNALVSADADYIYNGKAFPDFTVGDLDFEFGEIVLIDNDGNKRYDVVMIKNAEIVVLDAVNLDTETIYDKNNASPIVLKSKDNVTIVKDGEISDYESLNEWDILNVYQSKDKQYIEIDASSRKIEGTIGEITSIGTVAVNGELFNVNTDSLRQKLELGSEYVLCIDATGNIAAIMNDVSSKTKAAYFLDARVESGLDGSLSIRLFTEEGNFKTFSFADKASIDNKTLTGTTGAGTLSEADARDYLKTNADGALVLYELNSKKLINKITLPIGKNEYTFNDESESRFRVDYDTDPLEYTRGIQYRSEQSSFEGKLNLANTTKVFVVPDDHGDEEAFEVCYPSDITRNGRYFAKGYSVGIPDGRSEYVVYPPLTTENIFTDDSPLFVVESVSAIVTDDGENRQRITGYSRTGKVEYLSAQEDTFSSVDPGDIIEIPVSLGKKGTIGEYNILIDYNPSTNKATAKADDAFNGVYAAACKLIFKNVYYRYGDLIGVVDGVPGASVTEEEIENQDLSDVPLYSFDNSRKEKIMPATTAEINDWLRTQGEYSKIFIYTSNAYVRFALIYNKIVK